MKKQNLLSLKKMGVILLLCITSSLHNLKAATINVQDSIFTNTHWTACNQYLMFGYVYVVNGVTLTIDPGVIIKGDKNSKGALIVERGAKIMAQGTLAQPIVFTSNQPAGTRTYGDWGGVILCGKAPTNWVAGQQQVEGGPRSFYGGTLPHDNSGVFSYVRIEFAGIAFSPNNEVNGLTLCSVGDATQVDHIQVSYSGDDSFEWFGGTVNCKYLVAYRGWDDDFDTDCGYSGKVQFGFCQRDPFAADQSGSKSFESDSYQAGTKTGLAGDTTGLTRPTFSNITIVGPLVSPTSTAYDPQFVSALHFRRGTACSIMNSIIVGYPAGILWDESSSGFGSTVRNYDIMSAAGDSIGQVRNCIIAGIPTNVTPTRKELMLVQNGARSLTPTNVEDTVTQFANSPNPPFAGNVGPYELYYDLPQLGYSSPHDPGVFKYGNIQYPTEQTGVKLSSPFNLAVPNPLPTSISPVCYNGTALPLYVKTHYLACCAQNDHFGNGNVYPFNPMNPINCDTSNFFANYNAPLVKPGWNSGKLQGNWWTPTNYIGGFSGTQQTSANWMNGWCNFDPVNTDYSGTAAPVATITPSTSQQICANNGSVTLTSSTGPGYTYQWQLNSVNINGATNSTYNATAAGTYVVIVTNSTNCSTTSAAVAVTVLPAPSAAVTPSGATTFCAGGSVTLTAASNSSYAWSNAATTQTINITSSGTYFVTVTDANGCTATSSNTVVTVNALPTSSITANGPTTFCSGDSVRLSANVSTSYLWSNAATTHAIEVTSSGTYTVQVTNAAGCQSTPSPAITVSVGNSPTPTISANGPTTICTPATVTLTCNTTATTYLWSPGGATTQSIVASASGTYNCTVTNTNPCNGAGTSNSITVTINPSPTATFTSAGTAPTFNFSNTSTGASTYFWDFGDFNSSSAMNPSHTYSSANGIYSVCLTATTSLGCTATVCHNVDVNTGVNEQVENLAMVTLYPNPLSEEATLEFNLTEKAQVTIVMFNLEGKVMYSTQESFDAGINKVSIDATQIPEGIYFTRITTDKITKTIKTMVIK